jgi:hypothetical protein
MVDASIIPAVHHARRMTNVGEPSPYSDHVDHNSQAWINRPQPMMAREVIQTHVHAAGMHARVRHASHL